MENYKYPGAKIILDDIDIQWIKDNMVFGEPIDVGSFQPRTPVYLFGQEYLIGQTRVFYEEFHKCFDIKMCKTFDELVLDELKITICYRPPLPLIRKKKLERIINEK